MSRRSVSATADLSRRSVFAKAEAGYAMAALLIALAVLAILLTVAMPVWRHESQREKEAELVFRGEQYARAIALYRAKNAQMPNALPPTLDVLVDGRFLRKKYKDPMTKDGEFVVIPMAVQGQPGGPTSPTPGFGRGGGLQPTPQAGTQQKPGASPLAIGGIMGVRSKSQETSIRTYRGATRYDQWNFTFNIVNRPGGSMPLANTPDGRGGPGTNPFGTSPGGRNPRGGGPGMGTQGPGGRPTGPGGRPTGPGGRPTGPGGGGRG